MSVNLRRSEVPAYLLDSLFYENLSEFDDDYFPISCEHFKRDSYVGDVEDVRILLSTLRFWGAATAPSQLYEFLLRNWNHDYEIVVAEYREQLAYLQGIVAVAEVPTEQRTNKALKVGDRCIIDYVLVHNCVFDEFSSAIAASRGNVSVLIRVHELKCIMTPNAVTAAASAGSLDCLMYLTKIDSGSLITEEAYFAAAEAGHVDCLRFLYEFPLPSLLDQSVLCDRAAICGRAECLRFVIAQIDRNVVEYLETVAESGDLECLQYVHSAAGAWNIWSSAPALLYSNSLECVQYALSTNCLFTVLDLMNAAQKCSLSVVQCLHEHGVMWNRDVPAAAALVGRLDSLQYLHEKGCAWDEYTCYSAAMNGHLKCLQFAHEHGCPWDADVCAAAAANNHLHCLQYLHKHRCPWDRRTIEAAADSGAKECLCYARKHGCPLPSTLRTLKRNMGAFVARILPTRAEEPQYFDLAQYVP